MKERGCDWVTSNWKIKQAMTRVEEEGQKVIPFTTMEDLGVDGAQFDYES